MTVQRARSDLYWIARRLGDVQSVPSSVRQRSVKPVIKRVARKAVYRAELKYTNRALRSLGLLRPTISGFDPIDFPPRWNRPRFGGAFPRRGGLDGESGASRGSGVSCARYRHGRQKTAISSKVSQALMKIR